MIRYLPGVILTQLIGIALLWFNRDAAVVTLLTNVALPLLVLSAVAALWFATISRMDTQTAHADLLRKHFEEREKLTRELERARSEVIQKASTDQAKIIERANNERERVVLQAQEDMRKAERRISRKADMKVGGAFALAVAFGVGMLFFQLMGFGLFIIGTSAGALSGYLLRWRQTRHILKSAGDAVILESGKPKFIGKGSTEKKNEAVIIDAERLTKPQNLPSNNSSQ
jgi:hypothetical protein